MDFLQALRLQSLFGGMGSPTTPTYPGMGGDPSMQQMSPIVPPTPDMNQGMPDIASRVAQLYHPDTTATDKFNTMVSSYPTEPKPSMGRKIGGAALGALSDIGSLFNAPRGKLNDNPTHAGVGIFDEVTGKNDYKNKIEDWKNQIQPVEQAANIERQSNANQRTQAMQTVSDELKQEAIDAKNKNDETKAGIAQQRANVYQLKATKPDVKFNFSGPTVMVSDPATGEVKDTGIPTGAMSTLDKMTLGEQFTIANENNTSAQNRLTDLQKSSESINLATTRGAQARLTKETAPGVNPKSSPETANNAKVRQYNAARELYNSRPDLQPFIKLGPSPNDFTVTPPSTGGFFSKSGPTPAQYKEINDHINTAPSTTTPTKAPQAPKGWKYVPKAGGGWTAIQDTGGQ